MNKQIKISLYIGILLLNSPLISYASCHSHIINNSGESWTIFFDNNVNIGGQGNVYFKDATNCASSKNGPCTISSGQTIHIDYTTTSKYIYGHTYITAGSGAKVELTYDNSDSNLTCQINYMPVYDPTGLVFNVIQTNNSGDIDFYPIK